MSMGFWIFLIFLDGYLLADIIGTYKFSMPWYLWILVTTMAIVAGISMAILGKLAEAGLLLKNLQKLGHFKNIRSIGCNHFVDINK